MLRTIARLSPYALAFASSLCIMTLELVASRLVARHVGASLHVWTSVIGIVLGGICLGNVVGGRLADRIAPRYLVGPLLVLGALLTLSCLWLNAVVGGLPGLDQMPWSVRTLVVVTAVFLLPATVIGTIGPVVAKMAVEQAAKAGSAIGDVYFWGAVGSIAGTFLAGFVLMYEATTTTIVHAVAAGLIFLGALTARRPATRILALLAAVALGVGCLGPVASLVGLGVRLGTTWINAVLASGHVLALLAAVAALLSLRGAPAASEPGPAEALPRATVTAGPLEPERPYRPRLGDLAFLAFLISLAFMALEMVAGRLVARHLGSSIYGWTSVIGVLLGGLSVGNFLGGKMADRISREQQASWLFLAASVMTLLVLVGETPPPIFGKEMSEAGSLLSRALLIHGLPWGLRVLIVVAFLFLLPAVTLGTVSPVVAKLAIERLRGRGETGRALGEVYAWGMVGSLVGTFLAGFILIDVLGTKGLILVLATTLAMAATALGSIWHAAWAGLPLGLCILAFAPIPWLAEQGVSWGVREQGGDPESTDDGMAYVDESNYYYIKVLNENIANPSDPDSGGVVQKRTLVLDNLIHGYFVLDHPEHIEYDYEYIYAQVTHRLAQLKGGPDATPRDVPLRSLFLGGGSYTFPRYLQQAYASADCDVAEIDPAVTEANHIALGLPRGTPIRTHWGDARQFVEKALQSGGQGRYDLVFGDAFNDFSVPWHLTTREFNDKIAALLNDQGVYMINIIDVYSSDKTALSEGLEEGQIEAVASVLRAAGNDREGALALARGLRTAWRDAGDGLRRDDLARVCSEALAKIEASGSVRPDVIERELGKALDAIPERFRGTIEDLTRVASETLSRAQFQRDQRAATDAVSAFLKEEKIAAVRRVLGEAGTGWRSNSYARTVVENWFGGRELLIEILRQLEIQGDVEALAVSIERAINAVEAELKESPPLLGRRLILSATEIASKSEAELTQARSAPALEAVLRQVGVRDRSAPLARSVAAALRSERIRGSLPDLARRTAEAARAFGTSPTRLAAAAAGNLRKARGMGAFLGSWVNTARKSFPHVTVFGTASRPGVGLRETFVVVASKAPLDLRELGQRPGDPRFEQDGGNFEPDPYGPDDLEALRLRSRGIVLTDDYAPVENLLAPVAATRGN